MVRPISYGSWGPYSDEVVSFESLEQIVVDLKEMEEEVDALREMQAKVEKDMRAALRKELL